MVDFSDFQRGQIVDAKLGGASVTKMANLLRVSRAAVSRGMMKYTNHGISSSSSSSTNRNSG
jgi:predicted transcriptional regulator